MKQPTLFELPKRKRSLEFRPKEFKVIALRECEPVSETQLITTPDEAANYWRANIPTHPYFDPASECFNVLMLNTRRRIMGHTLVSIGTNDTCLVDPKKVFRAAIIAAAAAIVLTHNHPSGDPTPSEADIKVTRDLCRAGQVLKVEVLDHVVIGYPPLADRKDFCSLRELGYLAGF